MESTGKFLSKDGLHNEIEFISNRPARYEQSPGFLFIKIKLYTVSYAKIFIIIVNYR